MSRQALQISSTLTLPLDAVTQKFAFLGRTGSGKTYASMKLAELMLEADAQVVVLDQVGAWYGLRLGDHPFSIPVFGGLHGDIPLEPTGGAFVADLIVGRGISVVLDVSQMIPAEQCRFSTAFGARFFQRKKAAPSAVHLFIEECQEVVPQNPMGGEKDMLSAFHRLIKLGRNFGIGVSLISQRPQEVNKKALNQTECMFAFQMNGPQERESIESWIEDKGINVDVKALLPKLKVGHAYAWSPQWLDFAGEIAIGKKRTADVSATPKVGDAKRRTQHLAPIDLAEVRSQMVETIERAKQEDPKELRKENAELKRQLAAKLPAPTKTSKRDERLRKENEGLREEIASLRTTAKRLQRLGSKDRWDAGLATFAKGLEQFRKLGDELVAAILEEPPPPTPNPNTDVRGPTQPQRTAAPTQRPHSTASTNGISEVGRGGLQRILIALAQRPNGLTQGQIAVRSRMSSNSGTFATYLAKARAAGWIDGGRGDVLTISPAGLKALGHYTPLPVGDALRAHWLEELGSGGISRLLHTIAGHYPDSIGSDAVAAEAGFSDNSGTFATYLAKLRALELITGRGNVRASDELFDK